MSKGNVPSIGKSMVAVISECEILYNRSRAWAYTHQGQDYDPCNTQKNTNFSCVTVNENSFIEFRDCLMRSVLDDQLVFD